MVLMMMRMVIVCVVGEPRKEFEAGRADAGKDQVPHWRQGDEEQWDMDRLAISTQSCRTAYEGEQLSIACAVKGLTPSRAMRLTQNKPRLCKYEV